MSGMPIGRTGGRGISDETRAFHTHVLNAGVHQFEAHIDRECDRDETDKS